MLNLFYILTLDIMLCQLPHSILQQEVGQDGEKEEEAQEEISKREWK